MSDQSAARAVEDGINEALAEYGDMAVRWVLVAEVVEETGARNIWNLIPEQQTAWDSLGLLAYATEFHRIAATNAMHCTCPDDEEDEE